MAFTVSLSGLRSLGGDETRALADLSVDYDGNLYNWQIYIPEGKGLQEHLSDQSVLDSIKADIDSKEAAWAALEPKTRTINDPFGGSNTVNINKEEIVRPDIPDYYALRRREYPSINDQLGAIFKGVDSAEFQLLSQKIAAVKAKYPKPMY